MPEISPPPKNYENNLESLSGIRLSMFLSAFAPGPGKNETQKPVLNIDRRIPLNDNVGVLLPSGPEWDPRISG